MSEEKVLTLRGKKAVWAPGGGGSGPIDPSRLPRTTVKVTLDENDMSASADMTYADIKSLVDRENIVEVALSTPMGNHILRYCGDDGQGNLSFCTPWFFDPYNSTGIDVFFINISPDEYVDFKYFKASGTWGP